MNKKSLLFASVMVFGLTSIPCKAAQNNVYIDSLKQSARELFLLAYGTTAAVTAATQTTLAQHPLIKWPSTVFLGTCLAIGLQNKGLTKEFFDPAAFYALPLIALHAGHKEIGKIGDSPVKVWHLATAAPLVKLGHLLLSLESI